MNNAVGKAASYVQKYWMYNAADRNNRFIPVAPVCRTSRKEKCGFVIDDKLGSVSWCSRRYYVQYAFQDQSFRL